MSFFLENNIKTTFKHLIFGLGVFCLLVCAGCNVYKICFVITISIYRTREQIFVLALSIFFFFCVHTISCGNEQASPLSETLLCLVYEACLSFLMFAWQQTHLFSPLWKWGEQRENIYYGDNVYPHICKQKTKIFSHLGRRKPKDGIFYQELYLD